LSFASPAEGQRFYLGILLIVVVGLHSFEDLQIVDGMIYGTFKDACNAMDFLQDDGEWLQCLEEAATMQTSASLSNLFVLILSECHPTHPELLWQQFRPHLCDDLRHRLRQHYDISGPTEEDIYDFGLFLIDEILREQSNKDLSMFPPIPIPLLDWSHNRGN
jgi:hypothetical protein